MRLFSLLCLITFFLQILIPCRDISSSVISDNRTERVSAVHTVDVNAEHSMDQCSPFCQCACCACPALVQLSFHFPTSAIFYRNSFGSYIHPVAPPVHYAIWQPPQLSA